MTRLRRLRAWTRGDISERDLAQLVNGGIDAYELVDNVPHGAQREAAWAAYALQTFGDKLVTAGRIEGYVDGATARVASAAFEDAARCLDAARTGTTSFAAPRALPGWSTPIRSEEQLAGLRAALESLYTYLAFELRGRADAAAHEARLAAIEQDIRTVERLWMPRAPDEIRGGIGDALARALDRAYSLGLTLAAA